MKKNTLLCFVLCLSLLLGISPVSVGATNTTDSSAAETTTSNIPETTGAAVQIPVQTGPDASVSDGCNSIDAQIPLNGSAKMLDTAKAVILYELNSNTMLYAYHPDERVYPASLVKLMTALILVESGELDKKVTASQGGLSTIPADAVSAEILAGETFTLRDMLYCLMITSANDACVVAAEGLMGNTSSFVRLMNQRAAELGCTGTNFVNVHGIHDEQQYTTARDIGKILLKALEYEEFRKAFGTTVYVLPATELETARTFMTNNYFLTRDNGGVVKFYDTRVTGGKSAATDTSDRSLVCTAKSGDLNLMTIVMGAVGILEPDGYSLAHMGNFEETQELLEFGMNHFTVAQVIADGKAVTQFQVANGESQIVAKPVQGSFSALPAGVTAEQLTWRYSNAGQALTAPLEAGAPLGNMQVWYGGTCLAQSDLVSMNPVRVADASLVPVVDDETESNVAGTVLKTLGIVLLGVVVLVLLWFGLRIIRSAMIRMRRRRRRINRQRSR